MFLKYEAMYFHVFSKQSQICMLILFLCWKCRSEASGYLLCWFSHFAIFKQLHRWSSRMNLLWFRWLLGDLYVQHGTDLLQSGQFQSPSRGSRSISSPRHHHEIRRSKSVGKIWENGTGTQSKKIQKVSETGELLPTNSVSCAPWNLPLLDPKRSLPRNARLLEVGFQSFRPRSPRRSPKT